VRTIVAHDRFPAKAAQHRSIARSTLVAECAAARLCENRLPAGAKALAGPLAAVLRQPATNAINQLLARPRVVNLFVNASATAHEKLVNVLQDKTGFGISTGIGVVTIDLHELVTELGQELGFSTRRSPSSRTRRA
jgi:hypothetical protein